jgi:hypothetical protein
MARRRVRGRDLDRLSAAEQCRLRRDSPRVGDDRISPGSADDGSCGDRECRAVVPHRAAGRPAAAQPRTGRRRDAIADRQLPERARRQPDGHLWLSDLPSAPARAECLDTTDVGRDRAAANHGYRARSDRGRATLAERRVRWLHAGLRLARAHDPPVPVGSAATPETIRRVRPGPDRAPFVRLSSQHQVRRGAAGAHVKSANTSQAWVRHRGWHEQCQWTG